MDDVLARELVGCSVHAGAGLDLTLLLQMILALLLYLYAALEHYLTSNA